MTIFLIAIPILTILSGLSIYKFNGRREFLKFDSVQFVYAFVIAPLLFIWMKSFLVMLFRSELGLQLSISQLFIIDSLFSLFFLYIYAFVVIHSLTKSFKMRMLIDPVYDMFRHSEYFHLWLTHVVIFAGGIIGITAFSLLNLAFPLGWGGGRAAVTVAIVTGGFAGVGVYIGALLSNPQQRNFMKLIKLCFAGGFLAHVTSYFLLTPRLVPEYWLYWTVFSMFVSLVICSLVLQKSSRIAQRINSLKDYKWGTNIHLFGTKK